MSMNEPANPEAKRSSLFLGSEFPQRLPDEAAFHIVPVPFEYTVSYGGGTSRGPQAIIEASQQLEVFDGFDIPGERGVHTQSQVVCEGRSRDDVFSEIGRRFSLALSTGAVPIMLGGEHAVSYPAVAATRQWALNTFGSSEIGVVQIDAHADLRDRYEDDLHSHATVMRRVLDLGLTVLQMGVRAISPEEVALRATRPTQILYIDARELLRPTGAAAGLSLGERIAPLLEQLPPRVYLTIDIDGVDPALVPATGTPEPGGLGWYDVIEVIEAVAARKRIIAADCVELAPIPGLHASEFVTARLVYQLMGIVGRS